MCVYVWALGLSWAFELLGVGWLVSLHVAQLPHPAPTLTFFSTKTNFKKMQKDMDFGTAVYFMIVTMSTVGCVYECARSSCTYKHLTRHRTPAPTFYARRLHTRRRSLSQTICHHKHTHTHTHTHTHLTCTHTHSYGDIKPTTPLGEGVVSAIIVVAWIFIPYEISKLFQVRACVHACA